MLAKLAMVGQMGQIVTRFKLVPDDAEILRAPDPTELLYAYTVVLILLNKIQNNDNLTHQSPKPALLLAFLVGHLKFSLTHILTI